MVALYRHIEPGRLVDVWRGVAVPQLAGGALLGLLGLIIQWMKWHRLLAAVRPGSSCGESLVSLLGGFSLGALSPGRLGELGRGIFLSDRRVTASAAALVDRLSSFAVTLALGLVGLWISEPSLAAGAVALAALVASVFWGIGACCRRLGWGVRGGLGSLLNHGTKALSVLGARRWLEIIAWSAAFNAVFMAQFYLFAGASGPVPAVLIPVIPVIFAAKALLPLGFMDLGVREGAAVFFFDRLGLEPAAGLSAALMMFGVNVLIPAVAGLVAVSRTGAWPARRETSERGDPVSTTSVSPPQQC